MVAVLNAGWFSVNDLRRLRQVTGRWAERAGLPPGRASDFVLAVNEIVTNAVRYGSPRASLLLRMDGRAVTAEVGNSGLWPSGAGAGPAASRPGEMGLALACQICDAVRIQTGPGGTTVTLRVNLPDSRATHKR